MLSIQEMTWPLYRKGTCTQVTHQLISCCRAHRLSPVRLCRPDSNTSISGDFSISAHRDARYWHVRADSAAVSFMIFNLWPRTFEDRCATSLPNETPQWLGRPLRVRAISITPWLCHQAPWLGFWNDLQLGVWGFEEALGTQGILRPEGQTSCLQLLAQLVLIVQAWRAGAHSGKPGFRMPADRSCK